MLEKRKNRLIYKYDAECVWIEAWGEDALRVRASQEMEMPQNDWALTMQVAHDCEIEIKGSEAVIRNGKIRASISKYGKITFYGESEKVLLEESE